MNAHNDRVEWHGRVGTRPGSAHWGAGSGGIATWTHAWPRCVRSAHTSTGCAA